MSVFRVFLPLGLAILLGSGCKVDTLIELYASDIQRVVEQNEKDIWTPIHLQFTIASDSACDKATAEIVGHAP